jgi:membrane protease YdiL (CAAX protease family)
MTRAATPAPAVWATAVLAAGLWFVAFYLTWSIFWIKIAASAALLAGISMILQPPAARLRIEPRDLAYGLLLAVLLWGVFWAGKRVSTLILPFAGQQIGAIYGKGEGFSQPVIFFLLLFVTGPCEEIYWRGFLQKQLMASHGGVRGWLLTTAVYAGVHIWSFNFMLIGAAAVAGAFWGFFYWRLGRLAPVIVSHALWSACIFAVVPIP